MTSILNINDTEVDVQKKLVELDELTQLGTEAEVLSSNRRTEKYILTQLRVEHLNMEESY